jgi:hypothetical protein
MPTPGQLERLAFTEVQEGSPLHQLVTAHRQKPAPDSREWWQEVAQGLGVRAFELKAQRDDLLVALKSVAPDVCLEHCHGGFVPDDKIQHAPVCEVIRAAIAKAEGR